MQNRRLSVVLAEIAPASSTACLFLPIVLSDHLCLMPMFQSSSEYSVHVESSANTRTESAKRRASLRFCYLGMNVPIDVSCSSRRDICYRTMAHSDAHVFLHQRTVRVCQLAVVACRHSTRTAQQHQTVDWSATVNERDRR